MIKPLAMLFTVFLLTLSACNRPRPNDAPDPITMIADDMRLPHEARPHGVPDTIDWAEKPRLGMGNDPGDFSAFIAWGQLYEAAEGNPATNTRVQIAGMQAYILGRATGEWSLVQDAQIVTGAAYREDFAGDVNRPADVRYEDDGSISVTAGDGHNYHFWPFKGRVAIDPDDIGGVLVVVKARLIVDDPAKPDDRERARYVLGVGADYWQSLTASWDNWKTNGDVGIGRFKRVTSEWRIFTMTSLAEESLRQNPPPLDWENLTIGE